MSLQASASYTAGSGEQSQYNHNNQHYQAAQLSTSQVFGSPRQQARVFLMSRRPDFVVYNNVNPRTRAYRQAQTNKESLEKQRLVERKGGFHKYEKVEAVTQCEEGTVGFMPESGRFDTDTVGEAWLQRKSAYKRRQEIDALKRAEHAKREMHHVEKNKALKLSEVEKYARYREDPLMGKKNVGSMPFDVVTLKYNDGDDGSRLQYEDSQIRYRAALRAKNIHEKTSGSTFDPVTGKDSRHIQTPQKPTFQANYAHADHSHW
jgi:hypothetical protein